MSHNLFLTKKIFPEVNGQYLAGSNQVPHLVRALLKLPQGSGHLVITHQLLPCPHSGRATHFGSKVPTVPSK